MPCARIPSTGAYRILPIVLVALELTSLHVYAGIVSNPQFGIGHQERLVLHAYMMTLVRIIIIHSEKGTT